MGKTRLDIMEELVTEFSPPIFLGTGLAIAYICSKLLCQDSYALGLKCNLEESQKIIKLSDTTLGNAIDVLLKEGLISEYIFNSPGRGRPRRMFAIEKEAVARATRLRDYWHEYLSSLSSASEALKSSEKSTNWYELTAPYRRPISSIMPRSEHD